jgi:hypothetical protein
MDVFVTPKAWRIHNHVANPRAAGDRSADRRGERIHGLTAPPGGEAVEVVGFAYSKAFLRRKVKTLLICAGYHSRPSFLIIGAQKAGTTALYYFLAEHPRIVASDEKELGFFTPELFADWPEHPNRRILWTNAGTAFADPTSYRRAKIWYHGHFPLPHSLGHERLTFEATPEYLYYPQAAERIFRYDPTIKLIVLLRNPIDRAYSAWNTYRRIGDYRAFIYASRKETRDFDTAIRAELDALRGGKREYGPGYVGRGVYHEQLASYLRWFDRRQILIIDSRDLEIKTSDAVAQVVRFLGLPAHTHSGPWGRINVGDYDRDIPDSSRRLLSEFYKPHNDSLYRLIDRDFRWT